jgi:ribonuclease Z
MKGVLAKLTTPEQAAEVFKQAKPKFAVFSHIVTKEMQGKKGEDEIIARTRAAGYDGPLMMAVDRMRFEIADEVKLLDTVPIEQLPNLDSKGQVYP